MILLRMSFWKRDRQGHPVALSQPRAHSDAGSQHTAVTFTDELAFNGIVPSIGSIGGVHDGALLDSLNER